MEELRKENADQASKISDLQAHVEKLETDLQKKVNEMDALIESQGTMGLLLRDMESITVQSLEQENQIAALTQRSETLEERLRTKCAELDEMGATLSETNSKHEKHIELATMREEILKGEHDKTSKELEKKDSIIEEVTKKLGSTRTKLDDTKAKLNDSTMKFEEEIKLLKTKVEILNGDLEVKSTKLEESESALDQTREKMDVLLCNFDSVTVRNAEHVKQIEKLKESLLSFSVAASGFFVPQNAVAQLMTEQTKALSLVLEEPEDVLNRLASEKEKMKKRMARLERVISSAEPVAFEKLVMKEYIPSFDHSNMNPDCDHEVDDEMRDEGTDQRDSPSDVEENENSSSLGLAGENAKEDDEELSTDEAAAIGEIKDQKNKQKLESTEEMWSPVVTIQRKKNDTFIPNPNLLVTDE